jgi:hypothetical protein
MVTLTLGVRVTWPVGSAPKGYCPELPGRLRRLRALASCSAMASWFRPARALLWEDRYLTGPPCRDLGHRSYAISRMA